MTDYGGQNDATGSEHAMQLSRGLPRTLKMLENVLGHHGIEVTVGERQGRWRVEVPHRGTRVTLKANNEFGPNLKAVHFTIVRLQRADRAFATSKVKNPLRFPELVPIETRDGWSHLLAATQF
ncbi:MAG: hypothetical protein WC815_09475 [Vicinamibacterales bacterium]|jgi:hypothetical protein